MFWGQKICGEKFRLPPFPAEAPVAGPRGFLSTEGSASSALAASAWPQRFLLKLSKTSYKIQKAKRERLSGSL